MIPCLSNDSPATAERIGRGGTRRLAMRRTRPILVVIVLLVASLGGAPIVSARSYVDPTTLTPPLKAFRVCWQLGPEVQCDTSGVTSIENVPTDDSPCGQIYETSTE